MLIDRYLQGDYKAVWLEIGQQHQSALSPESFADIESVAIATMERVAVNIETLIAHLSSIGWQFADQDHIWERPTEQDKASIKQVESLLGRLPIALKACLTVVGGLYLAGSLPGTVRTTYRFNSDVSQDTVLGDPLSLPSGRWLYYNYAEWQEDYGDLRPFPFEFAPDEYHKANYSGGSHLIDLPQVAVDPIIKRVNNRAGITLIEYLRTSFQWAGFPGYEFESTEIMPQALNDIIPTLLQF